MAMRVTIGGVLLSGALLMPLVMALLQPVSLLRVRTGEGNVVLCARVDDGALVTLSFTHSMYGGFVNETYDVDESDELARRRIVTENAAAAEYYATDGRVRHVADGYEVIAGPFSTDELVVRVDPIGDHELIIGSSTWQLFEMFGRPVQLRLTGDRMPRFQVPDTCTAPSPGVHTKGLSE